MEKTKIQIEALIDADLRKVWAYYTQPEHITGWNFASPDWECPSASNDLRVGGKYSARMQAKDKSFGFDFEATYNQLIPEQSFTYTMPDDRVVEVKFEKEVNFTRVIISFDAENVHPIEMQKEGWQSILNNFKAYTEAN